MSRRLAWAISVLVLASMLTRNALAAGPAAKAPATVPAVAPAATKSSDDDLKFDDEPGSSAAPTSANPTAAKSAEAPPISAPSPAPPAGSTESTPAPADPPDAVSPPGAAPNEEESTTEPAGKSKRNITLTQKGKPLNWATELRWAQFKTPRGHNLRGPVLRIDVPASSGKDLSESSLENGSVLSSEKGVLRLRLGSLKDTLQLPKDAPPVQIAMRLESSKIEKQLCAKQGLKIDQLGAVAKTPYYLLFTCVRRAGRILVGFSHPLELGSFSSTAVEREGKGEGYKIYELTTSSNLGTQGELMRFEFRVGGETQKFRIVDSQRTGKNEEPKEPVFVYRASLGLGNFAVNAPNRSQSSFQPVVSGEFRTAPFLGRFAGSGGFFLSPGIGLSGDAETYLSFEAGLGYRIGGSPKGHDFYVEPSVRFYTIHQEFTKLGLSAHHNQAGFGLVLGTKGALDPSGFELEIGASGYGTTDQASHLEGGLRYAFQMGSLPSGIGATYAQQEQKGASGTYSFQRALLQLYFWP